MKPLIHLPTSYLLPLQKGIVVTQQVSYAKESFDLSFELFPPKTAESEAMLWQTVDELMGFDPTLITCTYGAGGSTQTKTLEVLDGVLVRYPTVAVASHLTCVGRTTDQLREYLRECSTKECGDFNCRITWRSATGRDYFYSNRQWPSLCCRVGSSY